MTPVTTSAAPSADIFQTVANGSDMFITTVMTVVLGILAFMLAKWLIQAKTFMAAVIALCAFGALMWGTTAVKGNTFEGTMSETWTSMTGGTAAKDAPAQAPKG